MRQRWWLALLVMVAVLLVGTAPRPETARAQQDDGTKLNVVRAAYDILMDLFYRPLDERELLNAGWNALSVQARRSDLAPPPALQLPEGREEAFDAFAEAYRRYVANLPRGVSLTSVAFVVADGMARSLRERHTAFLPPEAYRAFLSDLGGNEMPVGAGIQHTFRRPWIITAVAPGGPAERAGLMVGDAILTVGREDVTTASLRDFVGALDRPEGSTVRFVVDRDGEELEVRVTYGRYYFPPLTSRVLPGDIGYLRLDQFTQSGAPLPNRTELLSELDRQLDELDATGIRGLIFDLRGNGGGSVLTTVEILGRFLPEDALTMVRSDQRGRQATGIVSGQMRRVQHPMVVLVDEQSASASEVSASTLREAGRAVLVGRQTYGALSSALILPIPEEAAMYVATAEIVTARGGVKIDEVGYPVDVEVRDTRTAADYRAGRDPQLEAAIAALAEAPEPPAFRSTTTAMTPARLRSLLARYMPDAAQIPRNDRLTRVIATDTRDLNHPNQWVNIFGLGGRDPLALQQALRERGWLGTHMQSYSLELLVPPGVDVIIDLYETAAGAAAALASNDFPDIQVPATPPVELGDGTVAYRGAWLDLGEFSVSWRRGNVVFTVNYYDVPGYERPDTLAAVARLVDEAFVQDPVELAPVLPLVP